ncbi:chemotaxis protein [Romboutsia sp.]|uniref:chemotaxis protein n=1 Tax=Romboutsia sp. TaxID=1965302 RepID=UPI003F3FDF04
MEFVEIKSQTKILLESGTNELEIMEFSIAGELFGINVAKVREIMMAQDVKKMPNSYDSIEGVFKSRDEIITVMDLAKYLNIPRQENSNYDLFIVTNFNKLNFAFRVEKVIGIDRISWTEIKKPDRAIYGGEEGVATGLAKYNDKLITILDFEKIIAEISPESSIQHESINKLGKRVENSKPILIVEDSMLLSKLIVDCLHKAGYKNTIKTDNGEEAWNYLQEVKKSGEQIKDHVACIVSDIEMPLMDGHHLTKLVKEDDKLKEIPLILFSSLITEQIYMKGKELGADEQITKPEIANLVSIIDRLT